MRVVPETAGTRGSADRRRFPGRHETGRLPAVRISPKLRAGVVRPASQDFGAENSVDAARRDSGPRAGHAPARRGRKRAAQVPVAKACPWEPQSISASMSK